MSSIASLNHKLGVRVKHAAVSRYSDTPVTMATELSLKKRFISSPPRPNEFHNKLT